MTDQHPITTATQMTEIKPPRELVEELGNAYKNYQIELKQLIDVAYLSGYMSKKPNTINSMTEHITTAPKDGTQILCLCSDGEKRYCWWVGCNSVEGFWQTWTEAEPVSWFKDTQLPQSLKEQALTNLAEIPIDPENGVLVSALDNIRRALEFLPN